MLNSIGSPNPQSSVTAPPRFERTVSQSRATATTQPDGKIGGVPDIVPKKRRAEDVIGSLQTKSIKTTASSSLSPTLKKADSPVGRKPNASNAIPVSSAKTVLSHRTAQSTKSTPTSQNPIQPVKKELDVPKREPKKGSFAEIMARAQSNSSKPQVVGTINHKPKDKIAMSYKKEMKLSKKVQKDGKKVVVQGGKQPGSAGSSGPNSPKLGKPAPDSTRNKVSSSKPNKPQPVYKGTMHAASAAASKSHEPRSHQKRRRDEYAGTDEEIDEDDGEDEEEEDDGYGDDYGSDMSDDMEAGFDEVDREETSAAKAARLEDEREAALEADLKKQKEEKRKKLQELAKKAKPQRY